MLVRISVRVEKDTLDRVVSWTWTNAPVACTDVIRRQCVSICPVGTTVNVNMATAAFSETTPWVHCVKVCITY